MFDWDDLRIFLAAARAGSLVAAGQRLGMDTATVGRRLARLETALKSTLLARSRVGLQLTAAGAQLFDAALEAESAMVAAGRVTQPDQVAGTVRISTAEGFGTAVLAPALPELARARPGLRIELAAQTTFLSPIRREVDMAITLSAPDAGRLVVEPLTVYQLALYATGDYLERHGAPPNVEALRTHQIVGYVNDLIFAPELRYLDEVSPGLSPTLASSSIQAQRAIIAAHGGIGVLPCFMADGLTRVLPEVMLIERRFWLSTHREVHDTARARAVRRWLMALVERRHRDLRPHAS
ncbi:LysR family transcriptional regulator [Phenylobacterium sp.]|uniref:LysR family transcriptional regulator n=1 Tax=Phenylobacterium sp. TaxID=1871053 RepID=UPI00301D91D6